MNNESELLKKIYEWLGEDLPEDITEEEVRMTMRGKYYSLNEAAQLFDEMNSEITDLKRQLQEKNQLIKIYQENYSKMC